MTAPDAISHALESVLSRLERLVRSAGARYDFSAAELDDLLQDVRIRLWRAKPDAELIEAAPASYVYRTAISAALDLLRRRRARSAEPIDEIVGEQALMTEASSDSQLEEAELAARVSAAVDTLAESRRVAVRMHLMGYDRAEIAATLGWSEGRTRNLVQRGLVDLRKELARQGITPERAHER
jgi:RNA polymerase sigma factor (sigma-70 family)